MVSEASEKFPKSNRILKRDRFREVYDTGNKIQAMYFTAFVLPNQSERPRIGITATRKIGNSVERNRARRMVRDAFRKNKWLVPNGVDIVINVRRHLVRATYQQIEGDLVSFLKKVSNR